MTDDLSPASYVRAIEEASGDALRALMGSLEPAQLDRDEGHATGQ